MADFDPDAYLAQADAPAFDPDAYLASDASAPANKPRRAESILARLSKPEKALAENLPTAFRAYTGLRGTLDTGAQIFDKLIPEQLNEPVRKIISTVNPVAGAALSTSTPESRTTRKEAAASLDDDGGIDWVQMGGAVADPAAWALGSNIYKGVSGAVQNAPKLVRALAPSMATGGAVSAAAIPTEEGLSGSDFAAEKAKQALIGTATGVIPPALGAVSSRVVSPAASRNAELAALKAGGVEPTVGQALGGVVNTIEQKLQVVPFFGDMIGRARGMARDDFNKMVINEVTKPLGVKVNKIGQEGIAEAGDAISRQYDDVLSKIKGVKFDQEFGDNLSNLKQLSEYMSPDDAALFDKFLQKELGPKISEAGGIEAVTYKQIDSKLGKLISAKKASNPELSDALRELQSLMRDQVSRSNPEQSKALDAANSAWAKLVRLEKAANSASSNEGVFTPAQLMNAVKASDKSVRKRAVARGEALMQDTAQQGMMLGNNYPDSGTAGRLLTAGGAGAGLVANPMATLVAGGGLTAASGLYTRPVQRALVNALSSRPDMAPEIAARLNALGSSADLARLSGIGSNRVGNQ